MPGFEIVQVLEMGSCNRSLRWIALDAGFFVRGCLGLVDLGLRFFKTRYRVLRLLLRSF